MDVRLWPRQVDCLLTGVPPGRLLERGQRCRPNELRNRMMCYVCYVPGYFVRVDNLVRRSSRSSGCGGGDERNGAIRTPGPRFCLRLSNHVCFVDLFCSSLGPFPLKQRVRLFALVRIEIIASCVSPPTCFGPTSSSSSAWWFSKICRDRSRGPRDGNRETEDTFRQFFRAR